MDAIPGAYIVDNYGVTKTNAAEHIADFSQTEISRKVSEILAQESREMATDINGYIHYQTNIYLSNSFGSLVSLKKGGDLLWCRPTAAHVRPALGEPPPLAPHAIRSEAMARILLPLRPLDTSERKVP